mgnify:FL=1
MVVRIIDGSNPDAADALESLGFKWDMRGEQYLGPVVEYEDTNPRTAKARELAVQLPRDRYHPGTVDPEIVRQRALKLLAELPEVDDGLRKVENRSVLRVALGQARRELEGLDLGQAAPSKDSTPEAAKVRGIIVPSGALLPLLTFLEGEHGYEVWGNVVYCPDSRSREVACKFLDMWELSQV